MQFQDNRNNKKQFTPINHQIRSPKVLCIDHENNNLGVIDTQQALKLAEKQNLDLVQITFNRDGFPTCRILNYDKFKYEQSKKQKVANKKQREAVVKIKEIKFRPSTDINDLKTKASKADSFLEEGYKIKVSVLLKGREINYKDLACETLENFLSFVSNMQIVEKLSINGKILSVIIQKKISNDNNK
jgi:translation initiation factor IF-3